MRTFLLLGLVVGLGAQEPDKLAKRYTYEVNQTAFSQKSPQEALKAVVRAIGLHKVDYLMAHLVDPEFVDGKIAKYKKFFDAVKEEGKALLAFQRLVKETQEHFLEDPELVRELKRFAGKEGEWEVKEMTASATVKTLLGRQVFFKKYGERWFLENRQR